MTLIEFIVNFAATRLYTKLSWWRMIRTLLPSLLLTAVMYVSVWAVGYFLKSLISPWQLLVLQIVAGVVGAVIMAFGYFFYEIIFFCSAGVAIINVPYNLIQGAVGVAIATVVMQVLRATKILEKLK
jgi:hypothetical protein